MQLISGFIDTYLNLSELEEQAFQAELGRIKPEERKEVMEIVTSWMRTGIQQGIERETKFKNINLAPILAMRPPTHSHIPPAPTSSANTIAGITRTKCFLNSASGEAKRNQTF